MKKYSYLVNPLNLLVVLLFIASLAFALMPDRPEIGEEGPSIPGIGAALVPIYFALFPLAISIFLNVFIKNRKLSIYLQWALGSVLFLGLVVVFIR